MAMRECKRCGDEEIANLTPEAVAKLVDEIHIDPALRVDPLVYRERLDSCRDCEALREQVLCAHCGCFILFRARPEKAYCPHPGGDKWRRDGAAVS